MAALRRFGPRPRVGPAGGVTRRGRGRSTDAASRGSTLGRTGAAPPDARSDSKPPAAGASTASPGRSTIVIPATGRWIPPNDCSGPIWTVRTLPRQCAREPVRRHRNRRPRDGDLRRSRSGPLLPSRSGVVIHRRPASTLEGFIWIVEEAPTRVVPATEPVCSSHHTGWPPPSSSPSWLSAVSRRSQSDSNPPRTSPTPPARSFGSTRTRRSRAHSTPPRARSSSPARSTATSRRPRGRVWLPTPAE